MKRALPIAVALLAAPSARSQEKEGRHPEREVRLDFSGPEIPAGWACSKRWKVEEGELRGKGDGFLERAIPSSGDFTLEFDASTAEKANVEVKLLDPKDDAVLYTFAFLGRYHSVLDGVKSCILAGDRFVAVNPRMWIFPGRTFRFEVRRAKAQFQMFLSRELGPVYVEPKPLPDGTSFKIRILVSTEGKDDAVRLDNVRLAEKG